MKIMSMRVQLAAGDDVKYADVKPMLEGAIRKLGRVNTSNGIGDGELIPDVMVMFDAADVKQGPETTKRRAKT